MGVPYTSHYSTQFHIHTLQSLTVPGMLYSVDNFGNVSQTNVQSTHRKNGGGDLGTPRIMRNNDDTHIHNEIRYGCDSRYEFVRLRFPRLKSVRWKRGTYLLRARGKNCHIKGCGLGDSGLIQLVPIRSTRYHFPGTAHHNVTNRP